MKPSIATFPSHLHVTKSEFFLKKARKAYHEGKLIKTQVDALIQNQIHWDYDSYKLEFISLPALDKQNYGDLRVPVSPHFVIPSDQTSPVGL